MEEEKTNLLNSLSEFTNIVADTGDFNLIAKYKATDATTNPTLLLRATEMKEYDYLIEDAIKVRFLELILIINSTLRWS